jgi:uncharacterized protein YmfQ (DUF2313 family)
MGAYDSMKKCMLPTGLYRLDGTTLVDKELQAYAEVLDPLYEDIKTLQNESFTATASDYGLRYHELALGVIWPAVTEEERRKTIFALGSVRAGGCSKAAFEKLLADLGITAELTEDAAARKLTISVKKEPLSDKEAWEQVVGRFVPAHIETVWDYSKME